MFLQELEFFFPAKQKCELTNTAKFENCTCCVIKPHAVKSGLVGDILSVIQEAGFSITDLHLVKFAAVFKQACVYFYKPGNFSITDRNDFEMIKKKIKSVRSDCLEL